MVVTKYNLSEFIASAPIVLLYFDAKWNNNKLTHKLNLLKMPISIGKVDVDENPEINKQFNILNVPAIAYFINGKYFRTIIGMQQDIEKIIHSMEN